MKFSRWPKNVTIAKISEAMKKQKLPNEEDCILFIDSSSIDVSLDANKNQDNQSKALNVQNKLTTK